MSKSESRQLRREARAALRQSTDASVTTSTSRRSPLRRSLIAASALAVLTAVMIAAPQAAHAASPDAPEIDPSSMAGALTLLVGGVLALTDRSRQS